MFGFTGLASGAIGAAIAPLFVDQNSSKLEG